MLIAALSLTNKNFQFRNAQSLKATGKTRSTKLDSISMNKEIDQQALDSLDEERTEGKVIHPDRKQNPHE